MIQDASGIVAAHVRSIREACAKDYTPEQISAWSGRTHREMIWVQTIERDYVWVVADEKESILGFSQLNIHGDGEAYIAGLYFVPEVLLLGLGRKMMEYIFEECRKQNADLIRLESTLTAHAFYQKLGFTGYARTSISIGGVEIECVPMEMKISKS